MGTIRNTLYHTRGFRHLANRIHRVAPSRVRLQAEDVKNLIGHVRGMLSGGRLRPMLPSKARAMDSDSPGMMVVIRVADSADRAEREAPPPKFWKGETTVCQG